MPGSSVLMADEVKVGNIIALSNNKYFYVLDIDKEFINDEVSKMYGDCDEVKPEHTKITFYGEDNKEITDVPGEALCICFRRIRGNYNGL